MGLTVDFEAPGTGKVLTFEGTPYEGLEVTCDSASIGLLGGIAEHYEELASLTATSNLQAALPLLNKLLGMFASVLEAWNVTKRGQPVPATLEGLQSLDALFAMVIVKAWMSGTVAVAEDGELGKGSGSGGSSQEALTAAAALSSSLPSSPPQRL